MRKLCLLAAAIAILTACHTQDRRPEELAMDAAQQYYDALLADDYDRFLAGRVGLDSFPASFREQLLACYQQFVAQQRSMHGGISGARATRAMMDTTLQVMHVYLLLQFADSAQEEIVVPMVEHNGQWKMR